MAGEPPAVLSSPNGEIVVYVSGGVAALRQGSSSPTEMERSGVEYSVARRGRPLVTSSSVGLDLEPGGPLRAVQIRKVEHASADTTYTLFPGKRAVSRDHYNEMRITLAEARVSTSPGALDHGRSMPRQLDLVFRAYDDGVAFRYAVPQQAALSDFRLREEQTCIRLAGDPVCHPLLLNSFKTPYEKYYGTMALSELPGESVIGLPLLATYKNRAAVAITEAHLVDYGGMYLQPSSGTLRSLISPRADDSGLVVKSQLPHESPWRVIMVADSPLRLIESDLIGNLNPPCAVSDTSWIRPGKTMFPWWNGYYTPPEAGFKGGLNTATMRHYIDFAARHGIEFHTLDGIDKTAWYGGPLRPWAGAGITTSVAEIDLPAVIQYAQQKKVGLRLWLNWEACRANMQEAFPLYEKWGIQGVMVDLVDRDDQDVVNFINEMVALAARHHLTVTVHNIYKPTGLRRTWPNLMNWEAVLNLEFNKWDKKASTPEHEVTVPFTRMLAGPMDYHHGGFRHVSQQNFKPHDVAPLVMGTRARALARYVVYEDYLPMVADYPEAYAGQPGFDALAKIPTTWDETVAVAGEVGNFITIAHRRGDIWYVGTMGDEKPRTVPIPLSFLPDGSWQAQIISDDTAVGADLATIKKEIKLVTRDEKINAILAPAGGHLVILRRLAEAPGN